MSDFAYLQLQIWNGPLEEVRKPVHPRNNNSEVGPRAGCSEVLRDGGGPTTAPPCPAEDLQGGGWGSLRCGCRQFTECGLCVCVCAYACMFVCCVGDCVWFLCVLMCTCACPVPMPSHAHLFSAVSENWAHRPRCLWPRKGNSLFPWPSTVIKVLNFSLTIISSK